MPRRTRSGCALTLLLAIFSLAATGFSQSSPIVSKIEPPNWWTHYVSPVMVLLYGENLAGAAISTDTAGVKVEKVQAEVDGKHDFVWLSIGDKAKPGRVTLRVKTAGGETKAALQLADPPSGEGKYQGITRDDVVYLIMPDRFADGDTRNDQPAGAAAGTFDRSQPKTYHGGDLKGIAEHLPYLKDLGVTAIWVTPLYENANSTSDYHGYGATDEYAVEDHFGTMADFQRLVAKAHAMGMKLVLDVVPNHVGPNHPWAQAQPTAGWLHGTPEHHLNTDYYYDPIADPHAVRANYISALDGWFADALPDLAQENPLVADYLLQNALWWTESSGIDAIRIDTFPYVPRSFWSYYLQGLFRVYPHFFAVGEVYDFDPTVTSYFAGGQTGFDGIDTHLPTPFDFPMNSAIRDVVGHGASAKRIVTVLRQDRLYPHPELLVTFIGNHDMKRFLTDAGGSPEKLKLGFSLLATLRGIPELYYGDEIGIAGGEDPDNRHDFPGGFPGDAHNAFEQSGRTPQEQGIYSHVQSLLRLRKEHPALREGVLKHISVADDYYAFTRETSGERLLIVFNNGSSAKDLTLDLANTSIADAASLTPLFAAAPAQISAGKAHLQLGPTMLAIYQVK